MASVAQKKAVSEFRDRLNRSGLVRTELIVTLADKAVLRDVARILVGGGVAADRLRLALAPVIAKPKRVKGGMYAMLRDSPLVGSGLVIEREREVGREIEF